MKKRAGKPPIPPQAHDLVCIADRKIVDYLKKNKKRFQNFFYWLINQSETPVRD